MDGAKVTTDMKPWQVDKTTKAAYPSTQLAAESKQTIHGHEPLETEKFHNSTSNEIDNVQTASNSNSNLPDPSGTYAASVDGESSPPEVAENKESVTALKQKTEPPPKTEMAVKEASLKTETIQNIKSGSGTVGASNTDQQAAHKKSGKASVDVFNQSPVPGTREKSSVESTAREIQDLPSESKSGVLEHANSRPTTPSNLAQSGNALKKNPETPEENTREMQTLLQEKNEDLQAVISVSSVLNDSDDDSRGRFEWENLESKNGGAEVRKEKERKRNVLQKYEEPLDDQAVRDEAAELLARIESCSASGGQSRHKSIRSDGTARQQSAKKDKDTIPSFIGPPPHLCFKCVLPITLIVLLAIVAGLLSMLLMGYFSETEDDWAGDITPVEAIQRMDDIKAYLVAHRISDSVIFTNPLDSAETRAVQWLAYEDKAEIEIPSVDKSATEAYEFLSRYILVVLYFSTDGPNWRLQLDFLSERNVCEWRGKVYDDSGESVSLGVLCDKDGYIVEVNLNGNGLFGELPPELTHLSTLEILQMSSNHEIYGKLPDGINRLTNLEQFAASRNHLTGVIPSELCQLTTLRHVFLGFNEFRGNVPGCIDALNNLETLFLSNNMLTGTLPSELSRLRNLQLLWLDDNMLEGDVTTAFNRMPFLRALFLEDNDFEGFVGEEFLRRSTKLIQLDVSNNRLAGSLPYHFFVQDEFVDLEVMDWHGNNLAGQLPDMLLPNQVLQFIALYSNEFTGTLPESWGTHLKNVFHLDLSNNRIEGEMPASIGNMERLTRLFLGGNNWEPGPVPSSWSNLLALKELSLKSSQRTGALPDFFGNYTRLIFLDMDNNQFEGTLPTNLGQLTDLEFLLLNRNRFFGAIPPELAQLAKLRAALLEGNYIMGKATPLCGLPNFANAAKGNMAVIVTDCQGNNNTLSPVECECCTFCCEAPPRLHDTGDSKNTEESGEAQGTTQAGNETHPVRAICHDMTLTANLNPRWESVYARESYALGDRVWFNVDNPQRRQL